MIRASHPTTIEVTKDPELTLSGDCIIGVSADRGLADISAEMKAALAGDSRTIKITLEANGDTFVFCAWGDPRLSLASRKDLVIRRSSYICDRTLAVRADVAAKDIPRRLVHNLRDPNCRGTLKIELQKR